MALAKDPALLILDEPTTGLDATVEAEVLDLVAQLQSELDTAVLFISHNLGAISKMCDRVGVLYAGRLVEEGAVETVLQDPRHPYTVGLLRCIPRGGVRKDHGRLDTIPGFLPQLGAELPGCVFVDRCPLADERCATDEPSLEPLGDGHTRALLVPRSGADLAARRSSRTSSSPPSTARRPPVVEFDRLGKVFKQHGQRDPRARRRHGGRLAGRDARPGRRVRVAARRRSRARCSASSSRRRARSSSTAPRSRRDSRSGRGRAPRRCRSSSRTPTRRSTGATRCGASSSAR